MEKSRVCELITPLLNSIEGLLHEKSGQFMIVGLDRAILDALVDGLSKAGRLEPVFVKKSKDESPDGKIFFIRLQNTSSMEYQALLYYYLELPLSFNCFVCLISTSSLSLSFFEKRVRSRFKNRIFFLPYSGLYNELDYCTDASNTEADGTGARSMCNDMPGGAFSCANHEIHRSLEMQDQCRFMRKYGLERYSLRYMLDLFEPIHFVLVMIAHSQRIVLNKCYDQFKRTVSDVAEIKKSPPSRVLCCTHDLMDAGIINSNGNLVVDFGEFREFINTNAPLYIQKLLRTISRPK